MPLGLGYIASILEKDGVKCSILDMNILEMEIPNLTKKVVDFNPDIVGITSTTSNFSNAVKVGRAIKAWNPETIVVMGGVHATFKHREIMEKIPEVDVVVRNEGEYTMKFLVRAIKRGVVWNKIKGITYRKKGKIVSTPEREKIENLDELPYPAYHLFEPLVEEYVSKYGVRHFPIVTSRGCPFKCIYCSTSALHGRKYRTRTISNVVDQIEYLKNKYDVTSVSFVDDIFTLQKDRVVELCKGA
jgi:radical SAM superfamily enzyme YgiQ (UPF0313 family)